MVKPSRQGAVRFELNDSQLNGLASRFSKLVALEGDGHKGMQSDNDPVWNWSSTSAMHPEAVPELGLETSVAPGEAQSEVEMRISDAKYSALGFEVDLSGSQNSDTPFLLPKVENSFSKTYCAGAKDSRSLLRGVRKNIDAQRELMLRRRENRFKNRMSYRQGSGTVVKKLLVFARQKLLMELSVLVPESIEHMKVADPSGNGELDWSVLQSWLEGQPDLKARLNLTTNALGQIATCNAPSLVSRPLRDLDVYIFVVWKMDPATYGEVCRYLRPEDSRFSDEELDRHSSFPVCQH